MFSFKIFKIIKNMDMSILWASQHPTAEWYKSFILEFSNHFGVYDIFCNVD
jgi:hypothetical protein